MEEYLKEPYFIRFFKEENLVQVSLDWNLPGYYMYPGAYLHTYINKDEYVYASNYSYVCVNTYEGTLLNLDNLTKIEFDNIVSYLTNLPNFKEELFAIIENNSLELGWKISLLIRIYCKDMSRKRDMISCLINFGIGGMSTVNYLMHDDVRTEVVIFDISKIKTICILNNTWKKV